jgi:hypothetical protein
MHHRPGPDDGLTLYQLLVSIVVIVILGSLFMAHAQRQKFQQQPRSDATLLRLG